MKDSKITLNEVMVSIAVVAGILLLLFAVIFSTPFGMQLYGDTLIRLAGNESHELGFYAFSKDEFAERFELAGSSDFISSFENRFGAENREENIFFVFYDIRDSENPCVYIKFGINRYASLVYMNKRNVCG